MLFILDTVLLVDKNEAIDCCDELLTAYFVKMLSF